MRHTAFVIILALICASAGFASDGQQGGLPAGQVQPLPKGVSIHQLNNGLQVLLIENPSLPMIGVNVAVKVGSAYETFSTSGMSHMLEHLLFNGTTSRTQKQLYDDVDRIGGYNNASTAEFYTNYMMVTPSEHIREGMDIQADMLFRSILPADKFEKEKGIVLEEISKSLASPLEQLERNTLSILYRGHALSLPTLGTYSTIQSISRADVEAFYRNNYVPNNMVMSVVGNFKTNAMLSAIRETYGKANAVLVRRTTDRDWATGYQQVESPADVTPAVYNRFYDGEDRILQVFSQLPPVMSSEYAQLLSLAIDDEKDALQALLKVEFPQRVKSVKCAVRRSPLGNLLESTVLLSGDLDFGALTRSLTARLDKMQFALPAEVVKAEVTKARTEFAKSIEKPHMFGIYNSAELVRNGIDALLESFDGSGYYAAAKSLGGLKLGAHAPVIIHTPSLKKEKDQAEAAVTMKLFRNDQSGKTLVVVQNDASNLLAIHYLIKHKAPLEAKYGKDASKILHDCFDQRMKSDANRAATSRFGFTFTVNDNPYIPMDDIYLHPDFGYLRVEGLADDVAGAITYLNTQIGNFVPAESEFKKAVEKFKGVGMMMMGGDKAKKIFDGAYKRLIYEDDPYPQNPPALTYEQLVAFAKEYFVPANMIVSLVSPAAPDSINVLMDQLRYAPIPNEPSAFTPAMVLPSTPRTADSTAGGERAYVSWSFAGQIDPKDTPALQALSLVLADDIVFDIREKQGLAYNMSAGIEVVKDRALFFVTQGTLPQNVEKLVLQYPKFFRPAALDSLTQEKLEKSVNMYLGRMMFRRLSSINQAFYLGNSLYFYGDYNHDKQLLEQLKTVTLADVKGAAKKYMKINNPTLIITR
jgi:predicted Zn-dependent peptidase